MNIKDQTIRKKIFKRSKNKFKALCQLNKKTHKEFYTNSSQSQDYV